MVLLLHYSNACCGAQIVAGVEGTVGACKQAVANGLHAYGTRSAFHVHSRQCASAACTQAKCLCCISSKHGKKRFGHVQVTGSANPAAAAAAAAGGPEAQEGLSAAERSTYKAAILKVRARELLVCFYVPQKD